MSKQLKNLLSLTAVRLHLLFSLRSSLLVLCVSVTGSQDLLLRPIREPKPAKRQQRQHSAFSFCLTSPRCTMGDIMQLVEHLIKAAFCFPVWRDKLLHRVNSEGGWPLCQLTWMIHNVWDKLKIISGKYLKLNWVEYERNSDINQLPYMPFSYDVWNSLRLTFHTLL